MSALLLALLRCVAPPGEPEPGPSDPASPAEPAEPVEPTEPAERGAEPVDPKPEVPPPFVTPDGTAPPGESGGPEVPEDEDEGEGDDDGLRFATPDPSEPDPEANLDPEGYEFEERKFEDMPYAPTAARKSAGQRNNDVLVRPFRKPIYSIAAAGRFATSFNSIFNGREPVQPFGFGVAAQLQIHFLRVFKSRFGVEIYAGYTRFPERVDYPAVEGVTPEITRLNLLAHTDVSAGPSLQIPIGPVFLQFGASAGVAFSTLALTQTVDAIDDELMVSTDALLRGGLSLGVPIYSRHGLTVGGAVQHVFSQDKVAKDLAQPDSEKVEPFGTWLEINLGYQMWF